MMLGFTSCGKEQAEPENKPQVDESVTCNPATMQFASAGGDQELIISSAKTVIVKVPDADQAWCSVAAGTYGSGKYNYTVTCKPQYEAEERSTTLLVMRQGEEKAKVTVVQAAADTTGRATAALWKLGWNLGNQFDAQNDGVSSETAWGNPVSTAATFTGIKAAGFTTVRIPVTWMGHIGEAPDYLIEEAWMSKIETAVNRAEAAGLKALVNIHHDGADSKYWLNIKSAAASNVSDSLITAELKAIWTQIANRFKDKGDFLMFETMNEIQDGGWGYGDNTKDGGKQYRVLNNWNQACVDAIRATGGNNATRWIGIPGYSTNLDLTIKYLELPKDPANKLAVAIHCYDPYDFTLDCKYNTWGSDADKTQIENVMKRIKQTYLDRGVQAYIGEFGCAQRASDADEHYRLEYLAHYAQMARQYGISIMLWDNGSDNGGKGGAEANAFMHHGTGDYISDKGKAAVEALVNGYK